MDGWMDILFFWHIFVKKAESDGIFFRANTSEITLVLSGGLLGRKEVPDNQTKAKFATTIVTAVWNLSC